MKARYLKRALAVSAAACLATGALAVNYTWTGSGSTNSFSDCCNWEQITEPCTGNYPDGTDDNALFPWNAAGAWAVDLIEESIGDLTIEGNVDFNVQVDPNLPFTLTVTRLKIEPTTGNIEITMSDGGVIAVE